MEKGFVISEERFLQSKNMCFRGLVRRRGITPTDIDLAYDYNGNVFIEGDGKLKGKGLEFGQRKHFENKIKRLKQGGAEAICIIFEHEIYDTKEQVFVENCMVSEIYSSWDQQWRPPTKQLTVLQCIIEIENYCENTLKIKL